MPFSEQKFGLVTAGKAQVWLMALTMALFSSGALESYDSVTVSQHEQYQDHESEAPLECSHHSF